MEPLVYIIAIMGCADDGSMCERARIAPATYTSQIACQAALPDALRRSMDLDYPTLQAACRGMRPRAAEAARAHPNRG